MTDQSDVTFVLCIEQNAIRAQALLLCESIRAFAGRHRDAPIVAASPRAGLGVDRETRDRLSAMDVEYLDAPLNHECPEYGSANRVFAAAEVETRARTDWVVVLDSDTIVLGEPELPADADAAVRPIDQKSSASTGPDDPRDRYWMQLARIGGVPLEGLPFVQTADGAHRVRACYNGGLVAARRAAGILGAWADLFARSVRAGLRPWKGAGLDVHASTGFVGPAASEYWGSNQAAAALAIWSRTRRVHVYSEAYNVPLPLLLDRPDLASRPRPAPVHVHYHWLFTADHHARALALLAEVGAGVAQIDWLRARLPLR